MYRSSFTIYLTNIVQRLDILVPALVWGSSKRSRVQVRTSEPPHVPRPGSQVPVYFRTEHHHSSFTQHRLHHPRRRSQHPNQTVRLLPLEVSIRLRCHWQHHENLSSQNHPAVHLGYVGIPNKRSLEGRNQYQRPAWRCLLPLQLS